MRAQWIADRGKYNRDFSGCSLCGLRGKRSEPGDKHVWLASHKFAGQCGQLFGPPLGRAIIDRDVFSFDVPQFVEPLHERFHLSQILSRRERKIGDAVKSFRDLRMGNERQRSRGTADKADKFPSPHCWPLDKTAHLIASNQPCDATLRSPTWVLGDVSDGSKPEVLARLIDVRITPKSGHSDARTACPKAARTSFCRRSRSRDPTSFRSVRNQVCITPLPRTSMMPFLRR